MTRRLALAVSLAAAVALGLTPGLGLLAAQPAEAGGYGFKHGYGPKYGHGFKHGHRHGYGHGYRQGYRHGYRYDRRGISDSTLLAAVGIVAGAGLAEAYLHRPQPKQGYGPVYDPAYGTPVVVVPPPVAATPVVVTPVVAAPAATPVAPGIEGTPGCLVVREYTSDIVVGGRTVEGYGYACLQADGSWKRGVPAPVQ